MGSESRSYSAMLLVLAEFMELYEREFDAPDGLGILCASVDRLGDGSLSLYVEAANPIVASLMIEPITDQVEVEKVVVGSQLYSRISATFLGRPMIIEWKAGRVAGDSE